MDVVAVEPRLEAFRAVVRSLLAGGKPPIQVHLEDASAQSLSLFGVPPPTAPRGFELKLPGRYVKSLPHVLAHRDEDRLDLLYRLAWRLTHGERRLMAVATDPDVRRFDTLLSEVRRDVHKFHAFVRFRRIENEDGEHWVAWHRPRHKSLALAAPFFVRRFGQAMQFSLLTPDASATWDGKTLRFGEGVARTEAPPPDELEGLWKTYYQSIFNPARLNLQAMKAELPVHHWSTLPELEDLGAMIDQADDRTKAMIKNAKRSAALALVPDPPVSLHQVEQAVRDCGVCPWSDQTTQAVFGRGPRDAEIVFVGEQPGDQEDKQGTPFVGPAGEVLERLLTSVGLHRDDVYLTNAVKHFKHQKLPKRRLHMRPSVQDVRDCLPWLQAELRLIRPRAVVCLEKTAAEALMGKGVVVSKRRGEVIATPFADHLLILHHPAAVLRRQDGEAMFESMQAGLRSLLNLLNES